MTAWAGFFYFYTLRAFSCPMGWGARADYNRLRRVAVLPMLPTAILLSCCIFMQRWTLEVL
jgi:hypothetical protein